MVKKLITIALGLALTFGAMAQVGNNAGHKPPLSRKSVTFAASDVQYWVGTGGNSAVVVIGWDDNSGEEFALAWGVRWTGSVTALDLVDSIATHDSRLTYSFSGSLMQDIQYIDDNLTGVSSYNGWCYQLNGSWASNAYNNQPVADGDLMEISSSCMFSLTTAEAATNPNAGSSCIKAQTVTVSDLTANGATLNIEDTTYVNDYTVMLYAGDSLIDSTVVYTQTIPYTTLSANTAYSVKVFSNCPDGTQTGARSASFRTPCVSMAHEMLPWTEDFNSYSGSFYSSSTASFASQVFCWDLINPYSTSDPYINNSSSYNTAGGKCLYVSSRTSSPTILVLPPFDDSPDQLMLSFDVQSPYYHGFVVGVITDITDITTFTPIATCLPDGNGWNHFEVTFAGVTTGRLAMKSNDSGPAYLDNVTVSELPSCVKPSQVLVSNITTSSADLAIVEPNGTNHYMVYYNGDSVEINSDTYTLAGLTASTRYEVSVRTLCSDTSTGVTGVSFRTACGPQATPYHEDFSRFGDVANGYGNAVTGSTLPCWEFLKARPLDRLELFSRLQNSTYSYGNDGYTLRIYGNYSDSRDILILPEFDQEISNLEISFMARPSETGSFGGTLQAGYITDVEDSSTFVAVANYPCARFTNGYDYCASTFLDAPSGARMALRYLPTGGSAKSWYIDDIDVHDVPACVRAQGISVDGIGTGECTLHVDDPTEVNHYRYYLATGSVRDSADFFDTVVTISGLTASTDYEVQVVSVCDDGTLTLPHVTSFSTPCSSVSEFPFFENFDGLTSTGDGIVPECWSTTHIAGSATARWRSYSASATSCHSGACMMRLPDQQSGNITLLVAPAFDIATANQYQVSLWVKRTNSYTNKVNEGVKVWANNTPDTVGGTVLFHARRSITQSPAVSEAGWYEYTGVIPLTGTVYIVMEGISEYGDATDIDDFSVDRAPSCDDPTDLVYDDSTNSVSWTAGNATQWQVRDGETLTVVSTPSYSNADWMLATSYTVSVRSICGAGDTNSWRNSVTFTTPRITCRDTMPLPFGTSFSGYDYELSPYFAGAPLPDCWSVYSNGTNVPEEGSQATIYYSGIGVASSMNNYGCVTPNDPYFAFMAYAPYDGTYTTYTNNMNQYGTRKFAVLPRFEQPVDQLSLSFDYSMSARSGAELRIGYIVNDTSDFTSLYVAPASYRASRHEIVDFGVFPAAIPANARMAMLWLTTDTVHTGAAPANFFCGIDNLLVDMAPSCKYPRDFVADSVGNHGFSLTWREVSNTPATQWEVAYGPQGFNPESEGTVLTAHNTRIDIAGLTSESYYDVYVRANCGSDTYSDWAGPVLVYTPCPDGGNVVLGTEEEEQMNVAFHNWGNTLCQTVFTADELVAAGLRAGDTVNNLSFNWHAGTTARLSKAFTIYMTHTTVTEFPEVCHDTTWLPVTAADLVLADSLATTAIGLTRYDLTNPFVWNGTDGIAITTFVNQPAGTSQTSTGVYNTSSSAPARRTLFDRRDRSAYDLASLTTETPGSSIYRPNIIVERPCIDTIADTTSSTDTTIVTPADATIAYSDILYWVGNGSDSAIFVIMDGTNARAWGYRFDEDDNLSLDDMASDIAGADPRLVYSMLPSYDMGYIYKEYPMLLSAAETNFKVNGVRADGTELLEDYDLEDGMVVVMSDLATDPWNTTIVPASYMPMPVDATIAADDIEYWVGTGSNSAVIAINWGSPDTALAWGLRFDGAPTVANAVNALANADARLSVNDALAISNILYDDSLTNTHLQFQTSLSGNYLQFVLDGNGNAGWTSTLSDGSFLKIGESAFGVGYDSVEYYGTWYPSGVVWTTPVQPVNNPADTVAPPAPVEAVIAASDILFWVGTGANEVVMAVNWADTALAWGYRFDGTATVQNMMDDIAAVDPRFTYLPGSFGLGDILYIDTAAGMTDTLRITPGNYWSSTNNGVMDMGMSQTLSNGDFEKLADPAAGIVVDSSFYEGWDWSYTYVYPMAIYPVTVPDTTGSTPGPVEPEHGPFCGAVGTEGCNAIAADSSAIVAWATGVELTRGPQNIANPDGDLASFGTEANAVGMATMSNTMDAVSLGDGGSALVTFATPIRNGEGPDFAVFENGFGDYSLELAFVEVSSDGERFVRFPATCLTQTETQLGNAGATDPTNINNLAGKFKIGYGTPFDLDELRDSTGINIDSIVYVRIVDVVGSIDSQYASYDAYGHIVNDPWPTPFASSGFDLTGVAVLNEYVAPQPIGIEDADLAVESVWPNPTADLVNVTVSRHASAVLYDQAGRRLMTLTLQQGRNTIDLSSCAAGVYMLRAEGSVTKIVKR